MTGLGAAGALLASGLPEGAVDLNFLALIVLTCSINSSLSDLYSFFCFEFDLVYLDPFRFLSLLVVISF